MNDIALAIFTALLALVFSLLCEFASPESVKKFILGSFILITLMILAIVLLILK